MKKNRILFILITLSTLLLLISCSDGLSTNNNDINIQNSKNGIVAVNKNIRNVCTSYIQFGSSSRGLSCVINTLTYFDNGVIKPIIFTNSKGIKYLFSYDNKEVYNESPVLIKLNNHSIAFRYDTISEIRANSDEASGYSVVNQKKINTKQALLDMKTGIFYDFNDFSMRKIKANEKYIFAFGNPETNRGYPGKTIYKINLSTEIAEPLNNPKYNPIDQYTDYFYIINDDNLLVTSVHTNDYILFINEDRPASILRNTIEFDTTNLKGVYNSLAQDDYRQIIFKNKQDKMFTFDIGYGLTDSFKYLLTGSLKLNTSNPSKPSFFELSNIQETKLSSYDTDGNFMTYLKNSPYIKENFRCDFKVPSILYRVIEDDTMVLAHQTQNSILRLKLQNDTITNEIISLPINLYSSYLNFTNDSVFYIDNNTLYEFNITTETLKTLYQGAKLKNNFYIADNYLFFYECDDDANIQTYSLNIITGQTKLYANYDTNLDSFIELEL